MTTIGGARFFLGDPSGEKELQKALDIALCRELADRRHSAEQPVRHGLDHRHKTLYGPARGIPRLRPAHGRSRDDAIHGRKSRPRHLGHGSLGRGSQSAGEFIAACESGSPHVLEYFVREVRGMLLFARGETDAALEDFRRARELESDRGEPGHLESYGVSACASLLLGRARRGPRFRAGVRGKSPPGTRPVPVSPCLDRSLRRRARDRADAPRVRRRIVARSAEGRLLSLRSTATSVARPTCLMPAGSSRVRRMRGRVRRRSCSGRANSGG